MHPRQGVPGRAPKGWFADTGGEDSSSIVRATRGDPHLFARHELVPLVGRVQGMTSGAHAHGVLLDPGHTVEVEVCPGRDDEVVKLDDLARGGVHLPVVGIALYRRPELKFHSVLGHGCCKVHLNVLRTVGDSRVVMRIRYGVGLVCRANSSRLPLSLTLFLSSTLSHTYTFTQSHKPALTHKNTKMNTHTLTHTHRRSDAQTHTHAYIHTNTLSPSD